VHARVIGNPVRRDISAVAPARGALRGTHRPVRILVIGRQPGCDAAECRRAFALKRVAGWLAFDVRHQAGSAGSTPGAPAMPGGVRADVRPFIEDMSEAYGWADVVICRAGALTVSRARRGRRGLDPGALPRKRRRPQAYNAQYLVREGAAC